MKLRERMIAAMLVAISILNSLPAVYEASDAGEHFEIESISIVKKDEQSSLSSYDGSVFTNGDVTAIVTAVGTVEEEEVTIYFGEKDAYQSKTAEVDIREDGKYSAIAEFELSMPSDENIKSFDLKAYVSSSVGDGEVFNGLTLVFENNVPTVKNPNFVSDTIGVTCSVEITDEDSGIAKIEYGWDSEDYTEYEFKKENKITELSPSFELSFNQAGTVEGNKHTLYIRVTDNAGNVFKESFQDPVGSDMDAPTVDWVFSSDGYVDADGKTWYGLNDETETITITAKDDAGLVNSGLYSITITDNEHDEIYKKVEFAELTTEHTIEFQIGDFPEGEHILEVSVVDNAGNSMVAQERTFSIDKTMPESELKLIENTNGKEIDGAQWFDTDDVIEFRIDVADNLSKLKNITVKINNDNEFTFEENQILSDENGYYVEVTTENIEPDENNKYEIKGEVTDFAGNKSVIDSLVVYKDLGDPSITSFTIEKKNALLDKVLNILTFGIYTNDDFVVKAYASDATSDSGVDYAELKVEYNGITEVKNMTNEGNGVFSCEISGSSKILYENISVKVYDKFGKNTESALEIEGAPGIDDVFVEQNVPLISLELPASDTVSQTGAQKWYSTNKEISISVQDIDSGIRNVSFKVNGVDITTDKNGDILPKDVNTQNATSVDLEKHIYVFDTDDITSQIGESRDGKYFIELSVTDNAGNVSVLTAEYYVDKIKPQIDRIEFVPVAAGDIENTTEFVQKLEYGFFFKTDTVLTVYVSDAAPSAGLDKITYRLVYWEDGTQLSEITGTKKISNGKVELLIPKDFKGQVYVEAFDNVNNRSGEMTTKAYIVDDSKPTIQITQNGQTPYLDATGNALYVEDNSFTVEITDEISGIREIGYVQSAEQNPYNRKTILIENTGYPVGTVLEDGWVVAAVENNLVTKVVKTFSFSSDDNNVFVTFDASDNALNKLDNIKSEAFSIDKTDPIINVSFAEDEDSNLYYDENRVAYITVIDRNITPELVQVAIENTFGTVPTVSFTQNSLTEYVAVVEFAEGDYTFGVNGIDLVGHTALVNYSGGNERRFFVDKTEPQVEENFSTFGDSVTEDSFNLDKTVEIKITEHHFDPGLVNLQVLRKEAGAEHTREDFVDVTDETLQNLVWNSVGDVHTVSFTIVDEGVYQIVMSPTDLAGNTANQRQTVVFEIDKTVPTIVSRNGKAVSANDTGYLDVYNYDRRDEEAPTIEFDDANIDHINYVLTAYIAKQTDTSNTTVITPVRIYLEEDSAKTGTVMGNKFTLPDFVRDGVYALELVAVDKAGNESEVNLSTYIRLVNQDVLAYIMNSDIEAQTGLYSFQYENGTAISKRPDNFEDIEIFVLAENESDVDIVLRDNNGSVYNTDASATADSSIYGMQMYRFTLESEYFKENFQSDTDIELCLSVTNDGNRIDLGRIHIDNIAPTCDFSEGFDSWKWYCSENKQTITISNISELLDVSQCKIYDNGKELDFNYSEVDNTMTFTLDNGWHNVGIVLSDMAGNTYNIQEKTNIHIGYFWLWVIMGTFVLFAGVAVYVLFYIKKRKQVEVF